jgi:histidinol-phosphate aminotransferase
VNTRGESGPAIARSVYEHLYAHKVLVRYFPNHPLTASFLRISIGTNVEMAALREQLDAWQRS